MDLTGKPIKFVVNSHYHNDHIRGNQVFYPSADIIAEEHCKKLIEIRGIEEIKTDEINAEIRMKELETQLESETNSFKRKEINLWITYYKGIIESLNDLELIIPTVSFNNKIAFKGSWRTVEIIHCGEAHTASDTIMYLKDDKILFSGDLVFVNCHPVLTAGNPNKWLKVLKYLKDLKINVLIPGHGSVGTKKDIELISKYILTLSEIANKFARKNVVFKPGIINNLPPPFNSWRFGDFFIDMNMQFLIESNKNSSFKINQI